MLQRKRMDVFFVCRHLETWSIEMKEVVLRGIVPWIVEKGFVESSVVVV